MVGQRELVEGGAFDFGRGHWWVGKARARADLLWQRTVNGNALRRSSNPRLIKQQHASLTDRQEKELEN